MKILVLLISLAVARAFTPKITSQPYGYFSSCASVSATVLSMARSEAPPAPVLDGKRVLPYKVMVAGLKDHTIPAVYAVLGKAFKRGSDGWEATEYVGVTQDLGETLNLHASKRPERVAHVRALSFETPEPNAMQQIVSDWRKLAEDADAVMESGLWETDAMEFLFDEDDDDEDEDEIDMAFISSSSGSKEDDKDSGSAPDSDTAVTYEFTKEGIDVVLDEVRPYLIADGGNVAVDRVDPEAMTVTLKLEGACGSCSSSTVTMQMGIERVLKEKFPDLVEVLQVDQDPESQPKALDFAAVKQEVERLSSAIMAMGGNVELMSVDPELGVVKLQFRGPSKVQQGIELALLDVPFVKHVEFIMG